MNNRTEPPDREPPNKSGGAAGTTGEPPKISDAEWTVIEVLWHRRSATSAEVIADLKGNADWHPKTVQTLLGRLVKKGFVRFDVERGRYIYRPAIEREQVVSEAGKSFLHRVFHGDAASLLLHFAPDAELTTEQASALRTLLDRIEGEP